jgi:hypothetical protein
MLSGHLRRDDTDHHGSQCSQESSDSDLESQNSSQIQTKSKLAYYNFTCWKFRDTIQADFSDLGSLGERRQKLIEHFRTRTSSERALCVRSVIVFTDPRRAQVAVPAPSTGRGAGLPSSGQPLYRQHMCRSWSVQMLGERARVRDANRGLYHFRKDRKAGA